MITDCTSYVRLDLLEKNRVVFQLSAERNYHIFYQLLYATNDELLGQLCLPTRISADYVNLQKGVPDVNGIDDLEEFGLTEVCFDTTKAKEN